jgi:mono/diheme cytochrome c family protein
MKKIFKWIGIVIGSLIGLVLIAGFVFFLIGNGRLNKTYEFPPSNLTIPTDEASLAFGKHRVETLCTGCHGDDLGGKAFLDDPMIGSLNAVNITTGKGGIGDEFISDEDYVRAIRHGVDPEGKPIFMPAVNSTSQLSDQDLASIIAYLKTVPPVDNVIRGQNFTPFAKIMNAVGVFPPLPVETISHETHVTAPARGVSVEYGDYLVSTNDCRDCHGVELAGAEYPDPTVKLITPNLTPGGELAFWSEADFINALRTGVTPGGHHLKEIMPWEVYKKFTDDELKAIYLYLTSLPEMDQFMPE